MAITYLTTPETAMTIVEAPLIVCALAPGEFKGRLASIAALNRDALRSHARRDLVLELRYAPEARERVLEMVRNEQTCCAFLAFELAEVGTEIRLTPKGRARQRTACLSSLWQTLRHPRHARVRLRHPPTKPLKRGRRV